MDRVRSLRERRSLITRLVAGLSILLLIILFLGTSSILTIRDMGRQAAELYRMELLGISHIKEANIDLMSTGRALRQMALAPTFVDRDQARAQLGQAMLDLDGEIAAIRQSIFRDQERQFLKELELELEHYKRNVNDAMTLIDRSRDYQVKATAYISGEQFNQAADSADQLLHRIAAVKEEGARATAAAIARHGQDAQWLMPGLLFGCLLFGAAVAVLIVRSLNQMADRLDSAIDNMAKRSFDDTIPRIVYRNEFDVEEQAVAGPDIFPARQASILVLEDSESDQEATVGFLQNAGCNVTIVNSGQEALELLEKSPYDVVLMNMQPPMTDGINATLEIRKNPAFDTLPIIAMTANAIHQDRERCLAAGMDGHIAKPIDPDQLFRALMCWISPDTQWIPR